MPAAQCKPGCRGLIVLMGRPIIVTPGWKGVLPSGAFRRYSFVEPVEPVEPEPLPSDDDEVFVFEEKP